ncbi:hypothetical protein LTR36_008974 [Oleoguttula mirabilis]|uniref:Nudix hydrolase domain-containing protein n=1 Tax=Oleoguttula mirabilis TaxID=1507867 RepID=A0AAV9J6X1_9PEZI|nr:hypothetical protein LTR36_008974 [Oleoguttula mirabilis]
MTQEQQPERSMTARVGRDKQRYGPNGDRLVAGVVPLSPDGTQVLLVQSSARKGWVLPKGGWETDETQAEAACREAWEEAGIECNVEKDLGEIEERRTEAQIKKNGAFAPRALYRFYEVRVNEEKDSWPEKHKRNRQWMSYATAKDQLRDRPELLEALERSSIKRSR